jgi:hypothetical protein
MAFAVVSAPWPDASAQAEAAQAMAEASVVLAVAVVVDRPSRMVVQRLWSRAAEVALARDRAETQTRAAASLVVPQEP